VGQFRAVIEQMRNPIVDVPWTDRPPRIGWLVDAYLPLGERAPPARSPVIRGGEGRRALCGATEAYWCGARASIIRGRYIPDVSGLLRMPPISISGQLDVRLEM
jgi:hypothetical protein